MYADRMIEWVLLQLDRRTDPLFVGIDGRSGAGKSTLAEAVRSELSVGVSVIEGDDFYGGGSGACWDARSVEEKVDTVIDWARQSDVLRALRSDGTATWHPFDWEATDWDSDEVRLARTTIETQAQPLVLLEGAYSCRPELHSLLDALVLLDPPADLRRAQLLGREGDEYRSQWESRWSAAEDHYFSNVMPPNRFDFVLRS